MKNLQKLAGVSAISEALIYVSAFIYFGAYWAYPSSGTVLEKMTYLADNQLSFSAIYFVMYVLFGVLLGVLVVALFERLKQASYSLAAVGSLFGAVWVALVIASGMLANIGLSHSISLIESSPERAMDLWTTISVIVESIGGGNELVGGLWVLLISIAAFKVETFSKGLNILGVIVGVAGIATVYPDDVFTEIFGLSQIVWFIWLGIVLLRQPFELNQTS